MGEIDYHQNPYVKYALYDPNADEGLKNSMTLDSEIPCLYIKGTFGVRDGVLVKNTAPSTPEIKAFAEYPFFNGKAEFEFCLDVKEKTIRLELDGNYLLAQISVNGGEYQSLLNGNAIDLEEELNCGENKIRLRLYAGMRNFFGPLHCAYNENFQTQPFHFNFMYDFKAAASSMYKKEYITESFGLNKIIVKTR